MLNCLIGKGLWALVVAVPAPQGGYNVYLEDRNADECAVDAEAQRYEINGQRVFAVIQGDWDRYGIATVADLLND